MAHPELPPEVETERRILLAWEAHKALIKAGAGDGSLRRNPYWSSLRDAAYARFHLLFKAPTHHE